MTAPPRRPFWRRAVCAAGLAVFAGGAANAATESGPTLRHLAVPGGALRVSIAPTHGGDLAGLQIRRNGKWVELLYRGEDYRPVRGADWSGKAPILWPAVGRNYTKRPGSGMLASDSGWVYRGRTYPIAIHGFARDLPWLVTGTGACEGSAYAVLTLRDTAQTRRVYPFGFGLTTEYRVWHDTLLIRQSVEADRANIDAMPFSIGNHITFRLPLVPGGDPRDTMFFSPATEQVVTDEFGVPTGQVDSVDYATPHPLASFLPLTAISLAGYADDTPWARFADPSGFSVTLAHKEDMRPDGTPILFNLWGDLRQGFFAAEPWVGKQNALATGDGAIALAPGDAFHWTIAVRISDGSETPPGAIPDAPTCRQQLAHPRRTGD